MNPVPYARILGGLERVQRAFRAEYALGSRQYALMFVQRKVDRYDEFASGREEVSFELDVLGQDGEIVLPLYPGVVDRFDLFQLAGLVEGYNDRVNEFFAAFEAADRTAADDVRLATSRP